MILVCAGCRAQYSVSTDTGLTCRTCGATLSEEPREDLSEDAPTPPRAQLASLEAEPDERRARRKSRDLFSPALTEIVHEPKLKGHRNDTSVLFSLGALSREAEQVASAGRSGAAEGEGSGLIDIRALSAKHGTKSELPMPTVDDLVNLGGPGLGVSPLLAPSLDPPPSLEAREGKRGVWLAVAGGGMFFLGAVVLAVVATRSVNAPAPPPRAPVVERDAPPQALVPPVTAGRDDGPAGVPGPHPPAVVTSVVDTEPPKVQAAGTPNKRLPRTGEPTRNEPVVAPPVVTPPVVTPPVVVPVQGSELAPFNRGAAAAALAAVSVASCKKPDGPSGDGHVLVTFGPSGSVDSAVVDRGSMVGTPTGGCIAGKFRAVRVPAFSGGPMRVGKSFTL